MAVYEYTARSPTGSKFSGTYDGVENVAGLRQELDKMGYALVKAHRQKTSPGKLGRVKQSEVVAFTYRFAGMYSAGLPIVRCLQILEQETENKVLKYVISDIGQRIETGSSLESAFGKHTNIFSDFFLGMLGAGESGGKLATALEMSASYLEKQMDLRRKIKSAFAYPVVVSVMCFVVVGLLLAFVIPVFSKLYGQLNLSLPAATQAIIDLSSLFRAWWPAILVAVGGAGIALRELLRKPQTRARWDAFKLRQPFLGRLNRMIVVSHFIRTFALLSSVGVSLIEALEIASLVAHNAKVTEISKELQQAIEAGRSVAGALKRYDIFPPIIVQLAVSGEEAGILPEMLNKGVDFLDKDIDRTINSLLLRLEPLLTLIMGIIIGILLISVYLPMFDYMSRLQ